MATTGTTEPAPVNGAAQSPGSDPKTELSETPLSASNAATAESEQAPSENLESESTAPPETEAPAPASEKKWPGWPGDCVFRLIVPVLKVGSIIGRKGELIKKMCEETRARIRVLDGAVGTSDRIVSVFGVVWNSWSLTVTLTLDWTPRLVSGKFCPLPFLDFKK